MKKYFLLGAVLIFVIIGIVGCVVTNNNTKKLLSKARKNQPYDAIIVPGVPFSDSSWSMTMKARVYWSYYLYSTGMTKNVIYSGSAVYTPYVESKIMAMYGEALGIPKEHIYVETKAEHSSENLYYSYILAQKLGFKKIALATDPYQEKLVRKVYKNIKMPRLPSIPIVFDSLSEMPKKNPDPIINSQLARIDNFVSITDREGFWERWQGTLGKKIVYEENNNKVRKKNKKNESL